jgi:hypothetical protein
MGAVSLNRPAMIDHPVTATSIRHGEVTARTVFKELQQQLWDPTEFHGIGERFSRRTRFRHCLDHYYRFGVKTPAL